MIDEELRNYAEKVAPASQSNKDCFDRIEKFIDKDTVGKKILDIGCGGGGVTKKLSKDNFVVGMDLIEDNLKLARQNGIHTLNVRFLSDLPFKDKSFDIVVCLHVLEHLRNPKILLNEINRIIKPDGFAIVAVPNSYDILQRIKILSGSAGALHWTHKGIAEPSNYFHIRFFRLSDLEKMIRDSKLFVNEEQFIAFFMGPNLLLRYLPKKIYMFLLSRKPDLFAWDFSLKISRKNSDIKKWGLIRRSC